MPRAMPKGGGNQSRTHPVDRARGQTALVSVTPATPGERCAGPMVVMVETQASGQSPAIPLQETPSDTPGLDATVILGKGLPELFHHSVQLAVDLGGRQLLVDGAYHARRSWVATPALRQAQEGTLGHSGEQVGHEVGAAALPAGPSEHRGDGVLQPLVGIGGYQLHPAEAPSGQRPQEGQPKEAGPENSPSLLPNESARPASSRESRRRQTWYLSWPTLVRGRSGGSAWPGGLRFGWRGYSEHRILLVARLPLHCTASRQFRYLRC